jgi:hypothetical protein
MILLFFSCVYKGLMSHVAPPQATQSQAANNIQQRPNSTQNSVPYSYETTQSPIQ